MKIVRAEDYEGTAGKQGALFTGTALPFMTFANEAVTVNTVNFSPGARTYWHSHERGQILEVLAGRGLIQSAGGPIEVLRAGYSVWIPAGERHWHGAAPDSYMVHTAISLGATTWEHPVSDADYNDERKEA